MKISKNIWHAHLYWRAYIDDRGWIEGKVEPRPWSDVDEACRSANRALSAAWQACWDAPRKGRKPLREVAIRVEQAYDEAIVVSRQADEAWYEERLAASKAAVQARFESGQLALCPYFWSIVLACLVYVPIVRPLRWFAQRVNEFGTWFWTKRCPVAAVVALVAIIWPIEASSRANRPIASFEACEAWLAARRERRRQRREVRARFWEETFALVLVFLKARKEQVCPFLNFVDDQREAHPER